MKANDMKSAIDFSDDHLRTMPISHADTAASVWVDRIIGMMGEQPDFFCRFAWIAEERPALEGILVMALRFAASMKNMPHSPARILYRLTKADTPTAIMSHTVTVHLNMAGRVVFEWSANIREMGK